MKEQTQQPGVRKWAGDDMIALQAEPLSAIQGFFKEYGNCIIQGCATTPAAGGKFNVAPGLLALSGMDADGEATFKVVPFSGVENVTLPLFFTLTHSVVDRVYGDGKVKPIAYDYRAAVSAVRPAAGVEFLELTAAGGRRFVDAVKITEKLDKTGNGRDVTVTFAQAATRENIASGEKLTVILGKIIRWLADLKALAFKDKVSKADMDAALQGELDGKLNLSGGTLTAPLYVNYPASDIKARFAKTSSNDAAVIGINNANDLALCFLKISREDVNYNNGISEYKMWHAGNFNPATKEPVFIKNSAFNKNFGMAAGTVCQGNDARLSDSRPANGGNADTVGGLRANMLARAYTAISFGNTSGDITTKEFVTILNNHGAFNQPFWSSRGTWAFAENKIISDTGVGRIHLAGVSVEVISDSTEGFTVHITTASSSPDSEPKRVFVYTKNYTSTAWFKLANSTDIPASLPANGGNADTVGGKHATDFVLANARNTINGSLTIKDTGIKPIVVYSHGQPNPASILIGNDNDLIFRLHNTPAGDDMGTDVRFNSEKFTWAGKQVATLDSGNLTLDTSNASYVTLKRNNVDIAYMGLGSTTKKDLLFQLYQSGNFIRIGEDGKNYSNNKEIATVDQIKVLSGGAAATAGQYVSGIAVNDHAITVTKAALPTSDRGSVNNRDWNTILEPGSYNTSPQLWGTNNPAGVYQYGLLTVECSGNSVVQTYCESNYATMNYRVKSTGSSFSAWTQVAKKSDVPTTTAQLTEVANKKFVTAAEKTKIDNSLEVICAGVINADGNILLSKGCNFDVDKLIMGGFLIRHNQNISNLIIMVTSSGGTDAYYFDVKNNDFKIYSYYINSASSVIACGFNFIAYKI